MARERRLLLTLLTGALVAATLPACQDKLAKCKRACDKLTDEQTKEFCRGVCEDKHGKKGRAPKTSGSTEACDKGDGEACVKLAHAHLKSDPQKAAGFLDKGCNAGSSQACFYLGRSHDEGIGVAKDRSKSGPLFQKACAGDFKKACTNVALRLVDKDPAQALKLALEGCSAGSSMGCGLVGVFYRDGRGTTTDKAKAKTYFQKACQMGWKTACGEVKKLP